MTDTYSQRVMPVAAQANIFPSMEHHIHRRIAWGAILGGVVLAISIQILLSLLGAGVGLGTVDAAAGSTPDASSFGLGVAVWWVVSTCIALFAGGYAAAWLAGNEIRFDGVLHGLIAWGIATILTLYLLSSAVGGVVGGGFSALGSIASSAGSGIKSAAAPVANSLGVSPDMLQQQAQAYLQPSTAGDPAAMSPQDAQKAIAQNLVAYEQGGADAPTARERIIDIAAAQMKVSKADATKKFDDAQAKLRQTEDQAKQKAIVAADATASGASKTAFAMFVDLLLGAIFAAIGGAVAIRRRVLATRRVAPVNGAV